MTITRQDVPWIALILALIGVAWGAGYWAGTGHHPVAPAPILVSVQVPASAAPPPVDPAILDFVRRSALPPVKPVQVESLPDAGQHAGVSQKPKASPHQGPAQQAPVVTSEKIELEEDPIERPNPYTAR